MVLMDIHSHILPCVDDGPRDIETSLSILEMMKAQGITDVIATPHFIATEENLEEYMQRVDDSYATLSSIAKDKDLPNIILGSEVFYFNGIGKSQSIKQLCINGSEYLLLELPNYSITSYILNNIKELKENLRVTPIIAHIERYYHERGFRNLLKLINNGTVLAQVNATSLLDSPHKKAVLKLIKKGYISFIATDAHSIVNRPPVLDKALHEVAIHFGSNQKSLFIKNTEKLYNEITGEYDFAEQKFVYKP